MRELVAHYVRKKFTHSDSVASGQRGSIAAASLSIPAAEQAAPELGGWIELPEQDVNHCFDIAPVGAVGPALVSIVIERPTRCGHPLPTSSAMR